jgi:hypothetical protein
MNARRIAVCSLLPGRRGRPARSNQGRDLSRVGAVLGVPLMVLLMVLLICFSCLLLMLLTYRYDEQQSRS